MNVNLVELIADPEEIFFDHACHFACRVGNHAVYCHSEDENSPRKCTLSWRTKEEIKDGDCPFFKPNLQL